MVCLELCAGIAGASDRVKMASLSDLWFACGENKRLKENEFVSADSLGYSRGFCDGILGLAIDSHEPWCIPSSVTLGEVKARLLKRVAKITDEEKIGALLASEPPTVFLHNALSEIWPCR